MNAHTGEEADVALSARNATLLAGSPDLLGTLRLEFLQTYPNIETK